MANSELREILHKEGFAMKHKGKGKVILIDIEGADDGAVAVIVSEVAKLANVKAVEVFDGGEVRISRACPVFTMDGLVRAAKRGEIPCSERTPV